MAEKQGAGEQVSGFALGLLGREGHKGGTPELLLEKCLAIH